MVFILFKISGCPLVLRVRVFLSSEYFVFFYSGFFFFSKVSYLVSYLWFFCAIVVVVVVVAVVVLQWTKCFVMYKRRMLPWQPY